MRYFDRNADNSHTRNDKVENGNTENGKIENDNLKNGNIKNGNVDGSSTENDNIESRRLSKDGGFQAAYRKAYQGISPRDGYVDRIAERLEEEYGWDRNHFDSKTAGETPCGRAERGSGFDSKAAEEGGLGSVRRLPIAAAKAAAAVGCAALVLSVTALPVMAKNIPAVYNIIARYAPALADFVLPVETYDTSAGITMQVEAVNVEGQEAEIIVSFSDAEDSTEDLIHGRVDLYDSYRLHSYGAESNVGGCSFLEYDAAEDKAYFKIDVTSFDTFQKGKLQFSVYQLLTNSVNEKKAIDISGLVKHPALKTVSLNGASAQPGTVFYEEYIERGEEDGDPRPKIQVMDLQKADASMAENITITGIGYENNILRLQFCRGNFSEADRHMWVSLMDESGEERSADFSVMWQEEVDGERYLFDEDWFLVEESELEQLKLFGEYHITDGSVKGDWEVTLKLE